MDEPIVRVWKNNKTGQKYVTIPQRNTEIQAGDYVKIIKL
tara:strand:- start:1211 stop:1330 length:120 start_codon:yes stop_codon:yes gene_type:complete